MLDESLSFCVYTLHFAFRNLVNNSGSSESVSNLLLSSLVWPQRTFDDNNMEKVRYLVSLLESVLQSITAKLNSISKDYRYVAYKLADEKRIVKAQFSNGLATTLYQPSMKSRKIPVLE